MQEMAPFLIDQFLSNFSSDVGIDLGSANTPVVVRGRGIRLHEPSYVAVDRVRKKVIAVGHDARMMTGRTPPYISVIRPIRDGVISDFDVAQSMLRYFLEKLGNRGVLRPRVIVGIPPDITDVEQRAVSEAARQAGARSVYLVSQPMAAAIGAGLPVLEPTGSMLVDIGAGTTDVAVIALGGVVVGRARRVAGDEIDEAILNHVRKVHQLSIGERSAEELKMDLTSPSRNGKRESVRVKGLDLRTGLPDSREITSNEVYEAVSDIIMMIAELVKSTLEVTPPELVSDIVQRGITITGGTAMMEGIDQVLSLKTGVTCRKAPNPLYSVALGTEKIFNEAGLMKAIFGRKRR
jgi:rod shape-determining protein MreB